VKPSNFHFKNKKHRNSLKIMNCCVFISGLKIEFFPRHVFYSKLSSSSIAFSQLLLAVSSCF
ncbi:IS5/IS1182 family transposase, partial [Lactobacillus amylovorus]